MILETARLVIKPEQSGLFENAFKKAQPLIQKTAGFQRIELRPCVEHKNVYMLLVWWDNLESHEVSFRQSDSYQEWKNLLHHFYDPFPTVEHFSTNIL